MRGAGNRGGANNKLPPRKSILKQKRGEEHPVDPQKILKYSRGYGVKTKKVKDVRLRHRLEKHESKYDHAVRQAARSELLMAEEPGYLEVEGMERTHKIKQKDLVASLDISSASKYFDLKLDKFGPYRINYTRNGRYLLLGGQKGHLAGIEWQTKKLCFEVHARETVRDIRWLHQETLFAAAQKKNVYIYDNTGTEIHCLKSHREVNRLEYLPYHFLLASVGNCGFLKYQDVSTGQLVSELRTKLGRCDCMTQNPYNAVINLGHHNGVVTMWAPTVRQPLVKMLCHRGPLLSVAVEPRGVYMATSGLDGLLKVWDVRSYKQVYTYRMACRPAHTLAISQKGMIAAGFGRQVYVFKDALREKQSMPYMQHALSGGDAGCLQFCPYEDVLGVGHANGFTSLLIPGCGEPNFDALEANPFESKRQRQEHEVKMLLEKIQPEMISLDPRDILKLDAADASTKKAERDADKEDHPFEPKYKMKGKSSAGKLVQRKKGVTQLSKRDKLKEANLEQRRKERHLKVNERRGLSDGVSHSALGRFARKKGS